MTTTPWGTSVISNSNSYYLDIGKLIEHCQGELGTGSIHLKSPAAEGMIFFDKDTIADVFYRDKDSRLAGESARNQLISVLDNKNFTVNVYRIESEKLSGDIERYRQNLKENFRLTPAAAPSVPENIGRYTILKELARGGMGVVFLGKDPYIERKVAIKISKPSTDIFTGDLHAYNLKFFREARSAGQLVHPNIVTVFDADIDRDTCYMAMEYIDGPTLRKFCKKDTLLPVNSVVEIILNACRALDYAHNHGVVHWDIKPENIMLNKDGAVKVTDFGIARLMRESISTALEGPGNNVAGTFRYMSPQHISAPNTVDHKNDIFSLGCVFYELLTGVKAFQGVSPYAIMYQITNKDPVSILQVRPKLPEILDQTIRKALHKDPDKRYQTCLEFAYDLAVVARNLTLAKKENKVLDAIDYLANTPFFEHFSKEQVQAILSASSVTKHPRDKVIVAEGQIDDYLFIVLSGKVAVLKQNNELDTIGKGECFGEMAYLSGRPRAATIKTITDCILMKISATLMNKVPGAVQLLFTKSFAKTLVDRTLKNHQLILTLLEKRGG